MEMKILMIISWLVWVLSVLILIISLFISKTFNTILFLTLFTLVGISIYSQESTRKLFKKVVTIIENIALDPIEENIRKMRRQQTEYQMKIFELELELEKLEQEGEKKYRDVVRKVLDLENKFNKKFKLLGETILKISKEMKE